MATLRCPCCGTATLFGPGVILVGEETYRYYDCACCHNLLLVEDDGTLTAKAGAW